MIGELITFDGAVQCRPLSGSPALRLSGAVSGVASGVASDAEVLFCGVPQTPKLPLPLRAAAVLHEVRVLECPTILAAPEAWAAQRAPRSPRYLYRIEAREGSFELRAESAQLHRQAAVAFYGALPVEPVAYATRWGWRLLLSLLRMPGAARLLRAVERMRQQ